MSRMTPASVTIAQPQIELAKLKKKSKKKAPVAATTEVATASPLLHSIPEQDNSVFRRVGNWKASETSVQSNPPTVPIKSYFPQGQIFEYSNPRSRDDKNLASEEAMEGELKNLRRAAEVHRNVRKYAQSFIRPGLTMLDICQRLEKKTLELVGTNADWSNYLECGYGFPTGCSLNHVAAHYSPNNGDKTVLSAEDICKLDFGVHVGGRIVDSAFTIAFDPIFDPLIQATQEATNAGLMAAGIDARMGEIGGIIQETIESFEFTDKKGKVIAIKPCKNLNGHSMEPDRIHGGQSIPIVAKSDFANDKMKEGVFYAIETFATTGKGYVVEDGECSHYMRVVGAEEPPLRQKGAKQLLQTIDKQFSSLVMDYPPLVDVKGSFTSQMEHTIVLRPTCKEIVSRGDDY